MPSEDAFADADWPPVPPSGGPVGGAPLPFSSAQRRIQVLDFRLHFLG